MQFRQKKKTLLVVKARKSKVETGDIYGAFADGWKRSWARRKRHSRLVGSACSETRAVGLNDIVLSLFIVGCSTREMSTTQRYAANKIVQSREPTRLLDTDDQGL